jgi:hypothetical protein
MESNFSQIRRSHPDSDAEYVRQVSEFDARLLRLTGTEQHIPEFRGDPSRATDNLHKRFGPQLSIPGVMERGGAEYPASISVKIPGFAVKAISKIRGKTPEATVYISESRYPHARAADDLANSA